MNSRKKHSLLLAAVAFFMLVPIVVTGVYSFVTGWQEILPRGFTVEYYRQVFSDPRFWPSVANGLLISILPIGISAFFVILALYSAILYYPKLDRWIQSLCMLPHTLKGVILAISVLSLYAGSPTPFRNRIVMLTCIYCIIILPYVYQGIRNNLRAINVRQLLEAAAILGAGKLSAFFRIVVPNMLSGILVSSLLGMSVIFSDYVVVKIIAGSRYITAQQLLYNARIQSEQYSSVIVLVLFSIILLVSALAYSLNRRKNSGDGPVNEE
ncbi:MAG: ABC transporter permease subunit [Treponema sp.]|jgi:putative spermidine/putrescine transport system permease protein|nr:ABC transporter permease subunit [Treponema sp.]